MKLIIGVFLCHIWCSSVVYSQDILVHSNYRALNLVIKLFKCDQIPTNKSILNNIEEKYFTQQLDHFNPVDNRTWKQRYQIHKQYYKTGGPIFLRLEANGPLDKSWFFNGSWSAYAKQMNAACIQLEHRYYGNSKPTTDLSDQNLVYLTSQQALADIAKFVSSYRIAEDGSDVTNSHKWVVFGGSYAGNLAAWARMKFPHLIHAAVTSSSPLMAKMDFSEYFRSVEAIVGSYDPMCTMQIKQANEMLESLVMTDEGIDTVKKNLELCNDDPFDRHDKNDVSYLFYTLANSIATISYSLNERIYKNIGRHGMTVKSVCDIMMDQSLGDPFSRLVKVYHKSIDHTKGGKCIKIKHQLEINRLKQVEWNPKSVDRQWAYQLCNEFAYFPTSNQSFGMLSRNFPVKYFVDTCAAIFGEKYTEKFISNAVDTVNTMYGGLNINEERIMYVHGSLDVWQVLGITRARTKNTAAILIDGTANIGDTYASKPGCDPFVLTKAREEIKLMLEKWLKEKDSI